jgi:pentatricopeptide repeat protein
MSNLNLGAIGNCTVNALIDPLANIVWACHPRADGDPIFCRLLHHPIEPSMRGFQAVEIEDFASAEQQYIENTAVLRTILHDNHGGTVEVIDFAPRFTLYGRIFCPATLIRRVTPIAGRPRITLRVRPSFQYGSALPEMSRGSHHIRFHYREQAIRLTTDAPISYVENETAFLLDRSISLILGIDEPVHESVGDLARRFERETITHWREWVRPLALPLEWQDAVIRSAITLKLCTFEETGAILAAMTTSVSEAANTQRNWDYRYCWLRDAFFVVRALNSLSDVATMENYLRFLFNVVENAASEKHLQPVYGIGTEKKLPERIIDSLAGYRGQRPVRVGNQAHEHQQHDVYGNVILAATQAFFDKRLLRRANEIDFSHLEWLGERAFHLYDKPDAGMWELRTTSAVHTSSATMCWAACVRLARIASHLKLDARARDWQLKAHIIREKILSQAWSEKRQAYVATFGGDDLDCGVLLMGEVGLVSPTDSRWLSTVDNICANLRHGAHLFRYQHADDFGVPKTAFTVCSFWVIDALARANKIDEARDMFNQLLACRNPLGLLSEDIDIATSELWGNFPQTYSHVGIINCAIRLSTPWEKIL